MRAWWRRWYPVSPTLYIIINCTYSEFEQIITKLRWSSFIDLHLVFPTNFRIVFLPLTNTVNLLEPYCGTITEPGLPVLYPVTFRALW